MIGVWVFYYFFSSLCLYSRFTGYTIGKVLNLDTIRKQFDTSGPVLSLFYTFGAKDINQNNNNKHFIIFQQTKYINII